MSLTFFQSDNTTEALTTPSYASVNERFTNQFELTYTFRATEWHIANRIANYIKFRNAQQTNNISKNVQGFNIGDYTCKVRDNSNNREFYARIEFSANEDDNTRFFSSNSTWENKGRTFTLQMQEIEVTL